MTPPVVRSLALTGMLPTPTAVIYPIPAGGPSATPAPPTATAVPYTPPPRPSPEFPVLSAELLDLPVGEWQAREAAALLRTQDSALRTSVQRDVS